MPSTALRLGVSERRLENVHLEVAAGDAITAEAGCTLVIRKNTIVAPG